MHLVWCSEKIISALTQLAGENRSKEAFLQAMRDATIGMTKLCGPSAPASVYTTLQHVWSGAGFFVCLPEAPNPLSKPKSTHQVGDATDHHAVASDWAVAVY